MSRGKVISILLTALLLACPLAGQNTRKQQSRKARLEREIALIDKQLKENAQQSSSALSSLDLVQRQIANRKALIEESDREVEAITAEIEEKEGEIQKIRGRLDTLEAYYVKLVRNAYKNRDGRVWYMYILASDNVGQAFRRLGYLRSLSTKMNTQAEKIKETKEQLEGEKLKLEGLRNEAEKVRQQKISEIQNLQKEEQQSKNLIASLNRDRQKYQKELAQKKRQVEALNQEIARIIREEARAAAAEAAKKSSSTASSSKGSTSSSSSKSSGAKTSTAVSSALSSEFAANKGKLPWPASGAVVESYGRHQHPVYKNVQMPFNQGVTIAVARGTKAKAIFNGVVKKIVMMPGYNMCVLVQHGGYFSFYCKLSSVDVKVGDNVKTGQSIGTVDTINGETQLHLQIWNGTTPQNPEAWLR